MLNKQEIEAFKKGNINIQLDGNIYEFLEEGVRFLPEENGLSISDVNDGHMTFRTEQALMNDPTTELSLPRGGQYIGLVNRSDAENKELLANSEYAVAILQVRPDLSERRDISFESYDRACKYLGEGKKPEYDMYAMMPVEPMSKERLDEIGNVNSSSFYSNLGSYMFEKLNNPETRPSALDGYFGTSASVSNVILIKEKDDMTALYVEPMGFKLLEDFVPEKPKEQEHKRNKASQIGKE